MKALEELKRMNEEDKAARVVKEHIIGGRSGICKEFTANV